MLSPAPRIYLLGDEVYNHSSVSNLDLHSLGMPAHWHCARCIGCIWRTARTNSMILLTDDSDTAGTIAHQSASAE